MIITGARFKHYQMIFHKKIMKTPFNVEIEIYSVAKKSTGEFTLDSFVGDSTRSSVKYKLNALYEREISSRTREKYGLPKEVNGIVYFSPIQLKQLLGTYKLDWNKTVVHFAERTQVIQKIDYLEPLFNDCVGVQVFVKDSKTGG